MDSRIIVALDGLTPDEALTLAATLKGRVAGFKAEELLDYGGAEICARLSAFGEVMADPKLNSIPDTMERRARHYRECTYLTVHTTNSPKALLAARKGAGTSCQVLGITVLTSMKDEDSRACYGADVNPTVLHRARRAADAGFAGIVCSPQELKELAPSMSLRFVTPGVRSADADTHDQERVMTPAEAILLGAYRIVVGREILTAHDPVRAAERINDDIAAALAKRA